jgi:recombination protein RecT
MECQLIIDYKGIAELVRRSGDVSYVHADAVYSNDEWSYAYGTEAHLKHTPNAKDRGPDRVAYYSYVRFKDGSEDFIVMNPSEIEKIRKRSKSPDQGPWVTDFDEMAKKTVFRRHSKWLPLSPEVRNVIEKEDTEAVDVSGWEEVLDEGAKQLEAGAKERPKLRDRVMSAAQETGEPPKE